VLRIVTAKTNDEPEFLIRVGLREGTISSDAPPSAFVEFRAFALPLTSQSRPISIFEALARDFGLADFSRESIVSTLRDGGLKVPSHIGPVLWRIAPRGSLIWWQIEDASGYLPVFPWEQLFWEFGEYRLIRKTAVPIAAVPPRGTLDAVLCFSCDDRDGPRELVERFVAMLPMPERRARIHIFADYLLRPYLHDSVGDARSLGFDFTIYEPDPERDVISDPIFPDVTPWLGWMQATLKPYAIDYVHVIAGGELGLETGNLTFGSAIAESDRAWRVPVGPRGFDEFLRSIGAWSASFSSPPANPSPAGLRFFTHLLAQRRAGPVLLHDMVRDPSGTELINGLRFYATGERYLGSPSMMLFKNPDTTVNEVAVPPDFLDDGKEENAAAWIRIQRQREAAINAIHAEHDPLRRETRLRAFENVTSALREGPTHE
jgi:hypothetical protein